MISRHFCCGFQFVGPALEADVVSCPVMNLRLDRHYDRDVICPAPLGEFCFSHRQAPQMPMWMPMDRPRSLRLKLFHATPPVRVRRWQTVRVRRCQNPDRCQILTTSSVYDPRRCGEPISYRTLSELVVRCGPAVLVPENLRSQIRLPNLTSRRWQAVDPSPHQLCRCWFRSSQFRFVGQTLPRRPPELQVLVHWLVFPSRRCLLNHH